MIKNEIDKTLCISFNISKCFVIVLDGLDDQSYPIRCTPLPYVSIPSISIRKSVNEIEMRVN